MKVPRREFLRTSGLSALSAGCSADRGPQLELLQRSGAVDNPLAPYASRDSALLDLLGRREEALAKYRQALKMPGSPAISHDQYGMQIDRKWVEERLQKPFRRESRGEPAGSRELP